MHYLSPAMLKEQLSEIEASAKGSWSQPAQKQFGCLSSNLSSRT